MRRQAGFTLLEVLVATVIMAIAVTGLLAALSTSMRNAARLVEYDRASMLARQKMDELLLMKRIPRFQTLEGTWDQAIAAGVPAGWRAQLTPFEMPPNPAPGTQILDRVQLEIWWISSEQRRTFILEGFRRTVLTPEEIQGGALVPR
jgi:type II secretion system protein I